MQEATLSFKPFIVAKLFPKQTDGGVYVIYLLY